MHNLFGHGYIPVRITYISFWYAHIPRLGRVEFPLRMALAAPGEMRLRGDVHGNLAMKFVRESCSLQPPEAVCRRRDERTRSASSASHAVCELWTGVTG